MFTVVGIIMGLFAFAIVPVAVILGLLGLWIFGFWGAFVGVILGLGLKS
jgi:hypothetical protein